MPRKSSIPILLSLLACALVASTPIGQRFPISPVSADTNHYAESGGSIAYDPDRQMYLVFWSQKNTDGLAYTTYGQFITAQGHLSGSRSSIPQLAGSFGDVVYNPDSHQYLVVYARDAKICGLRLDEDGVPVGSELTLMSTLNSGDESSQPAVAYSTRSDQYLLVWVYHKTGYQPWIAARTISPDGSTLGNVWVVSDSATFSPGLDVAWSAPQDRFMVVWTVLGSPTNFILGRLIKLGETPGFYTTPFDVLWGIPDADEYYPAIAAITKVDGTGQFLVVSQTRTQNSENRVISAQLVTDEAIRTGNRLILSDTSGIGPAAIAGHNTSQEYLVAWIHNWTTVQARTISAAGAMGKLTDLPSNEPFNPSIAAGPGGNFLLTANDWYLPDYPYDILGYLWGNRAYLPFIKR